MSVRFPPILIVDHESQTQSSFFHDGPISDRRPRGCCEKIKLIVMCILLKIGAYILIAGKFVCRFFSELCFRGNTPNFIYRLRNVERRLTGENRSGVIAPNPNAEELLHRAVEKEKAENPWIPQDSIPVGSKLPEMLNAFKSIPTVDSPFLQRAINLHRGLLDKELLNTFNEQLETMDAEVFPILARWAIRAFFLSQKTNQQAPNFLKQLNANFTEMFKIFKNLPEDEQLKVIHFTFVGHIADIDEVSQVFETRQLLIEINKHSQKLLQMQEFYTLIKDCK